MIFYRYKSIQALRNVHVIHCKNRFTYHLYAETIIVITACAVPVFVHGISDLSLSFINFKDALQFSAQDYSVTYCCRQ